MLRRTITLLGFASTLSLIACEEKKEAPPAAAPKAAEPAAAAPKAAEGAPAAAAPGAPGAPVAAAPGAAAAAPAGGTGSVKGSVALTGKAPVMAELKRSSDPYCAKTKMKDEEVVENANHTLKNVIVHINGAPAAEPPKTNAMIEQQQCMYRPRAQAIVAGQTLTIKNGDTTLHNVHTFKGSTTLFNQAQVPGTANIDKKFTDNGALLKFKCDVHQWMTGYVWVQNNPYFAVSDDKGEFKIDGVPAGTYDIEAWHERFGTKTGKVTISKDKPAEIKFEYTGTETAAK